MEKYYCFAGIEIAVSIPEKWMYEDDRHLAPFRVTQVNDPHVFTYMPVTSLSAPAGDMQALIPGVLVYRENEKSVRYIGAVTDGWEKAYIRTENEEKNHLVQVKLGESVAHVGVKTVLNSFALEHLLAANEGFVFHCSYIEWNGGAILFTAPSGTGKSTQAELWKELRDAQIINGDRAAVCMKEERIFAEGIPFSGSSSYCENRSLPLLAVVYLSQAPQTTIQKLRGIHAFYKIWEGVSVNTWDRKDVERVSEVVQKIAADIPVYHLACTPDETAVIALEEALKGLV